MRVAAMLPSLGPRLASIGVPAVIAMQGDISIDTADVFAHKLFEELGRNGVIDRAVAVARGAVRNRPDWWKPVLFLSLDSGRLWAEVADEKTSARPPHVLPPPVGDFTGRQTDIDALVAHLATDNSSAAITGVHGLGGIGKTQLALAVAERLCDHYPEQLMVDLQPGGEMLVPQDILGRVIQACLPEVSLPDTLERLQVLYRSELAGRRGLLLLDNAKAPHQIRPLLPQPPCWAVIVTGRTRLALPGAMLYPLDLLAESEAVAFLMRVLSDGGRHDLAQAHLEPLAQACARLPLALRAAASFLATYVDWSLVDYLAVLKTARLAYLQEPGEPAVSAVLGISIAQLHQEDALLEQRWYDLAVFPTSFDRAAAAAVWDIPEAAARTSLSALLQLSLIDYSGGAQRYALHDLLRDVALSRPPEEEVRGRHAEYYLAVAEECLQAIPRDQQRMDVEFQHIQQAFKWCCSSNPAGALEISGRNE